MFLDLYESPLVSVARARAAEQEKGNRVLLAERRVFEESLANRRRERAARETRAACTLQRVVRGFLTRKMLASHVRKKLARSKMRKGVSRVKMQLNFARRVDDAMRITQARRARAAVRIQVRAGAHSGFPFPSSLLPRHICVPPASAHGGSFSPVARRPRSGGAWRRSGTSGRRRRRSASAADSSPGTRWPKSARDSGTWRWCGRHG